MKRVPDEASNMQIFKGDGWELTFQREKAKNQTQYNVKLTQQGKVFEAKAIPKKLFDIFLGLITSGKEDEEDLIQKLAILISE